MFAKNYQIGSNSQMQKHTAITHNLDSFLSAVRSKGRYCFGLEELKTTLQLSNKAANQALFRAKSKSKIVQVRKSFYAILTPEYLNRGMLPAYLFIDDLMAHLHKRYYIGLLSAAALHGAAHQQPMETFVITQKPALRPIKNKNLKINFMVKKDWADEFIVKKKTEAGYINVSSAELTALDLFYYTGTISVSNIVTILKELVEEIKASQLQKAATEFPQVAALQRLGFIMDEILKNQKLAAAVERALKNKKTFPVALSNSKIKEGRFNNKWKVFQNTVIEADI